MARKNEKYILLWKSADEYHIAQRYIQAILGPGKEYIKIFDTPSQAKRYALKNNLLFMQVVKLDI